MGEIIFHIFIMVVLSVLLKDSFGINGARATDPLGPAGFPQIIIVLGLVLLCISLWSTFKRYTKENKEKGLAKEWNKVFIGLIFSIVLFVVLVDKIGFAIAAFILVNAIMYLLGQTQWTKIISISLVASLSFTLVFGKFLHVPIPRGLGFIKAFSYFIY